MSRLLYITNVKRLTYSTYFIQCDLVDREQNLYNGNPSSLLACVDVSGKPYAKVSYPQTDPVLHATSPKKYVSSLTLSVKDENGELFDFNEMPLHFELEIN